MTPDEELKALRREVIALRVLLAGAEQSIMDMRTDTYLDRMRAVKKTVDTADHSGDSER